MRNLLAGILANIFINALEEKFFYKFSTATLGIVSYSRYVDDILVIYEGPATGIDHIFILFNGLHENITFTCELENEALQLNFLDLTLTVEENKSLQISTEKKHMLIKLYLPLLCTLNVTKLLSFILPSTELFPSHS